MKKYILLLATAFTLGLSSCDNGPEYGDALFMTGTLSSPKVKFLLEGESSTAVTVSSTAKAEEDITVNLVEAPELLEEYNKQYGYNCIMPPTGSYHLEGDHVVISKGKAISSGLEITADGTLLEEGVSYCLPIKIQSSSNSSLKVLEASRTVFVHFTKVIRIKAAYLARNNAFTIYGFAGDDSPVKALQQMTLEMKVMPISFPSTPNSANGISSLCGCEENFLFRFGDGAGQPTNRLELSKGSIGIAEHPDKKDHYGAWSEDGFDTGKWHHFAAVYDGQYLRVYLDGEQIQFVETKNGGTINLSCAYDGHTWNDTFAIGRSVGFQRMFDGCVSECRVWDVARTTAELNDGICYVDPTTPGLVAYWRFNGELQDDGTVRDETGHGYNATPYRAIQWMENQMCPF
ncbi:MAG: DUF1735 and LamG domain-containing protein [Muribaculaceae bacterium]